ncbi:MAG: hypothetical protein JST00_18075 [Deltaproteobacteria bacterium]|nr:hypothetical protein [Deltaproteobacteria bacterium]
MRTPWLSLLSTTLLAIALGTGCAPAEESKDTSPGGEIAQNDGVDNELRTASDAAIMGKLRGILKDVTFTSESDYPYVVFEGEAVPAGTKRLGTTLVRQKLAAAVKANSDERRDILPTKVRAVRLNVSSAIAEGDAAVVPADPNADEYLYARHDKQLGIALKTMRASLKGVVGFTFGTNESGDQDEFGTVHYVYVGISKTTGKLIAIMTQAVYT